jgi:hypothetical protein
MNSYSTMSSNSFNLFFLFILTTFLLLSSTSKAQNQNPTFLYQFCSTNKTTANSTYKSNLRTLFSSLSSNAKQNPLKHGIWPIHVQRRCFFFPLPTMCDQRNTETINRLRLFLIQTSCNMVR